MTTAAGSSAEQPGEDFAGLLLRVMAEADMSQRELARKSGIPIATISAWVTRRRGQAGGLAPDKLRLVADALRGYTTVREVMEAAGRMIPAELDVAREQRLIRLYRALSQSQQRFLIDEAERLGRSNRMPRAK